jgi:hypothetical protein
MKAGWYILNYHDVNYEDSILTRAIGGTIRPDVFYEHMSSLITMGSFITVQEGLDALNNNVEFKQPTFSLWFDDGFYGLKEHAAKICEHFNIFPTVSICSRFALREEMFWRCKMSALVHLDGMRFLRTELRQSHKNIPFKLRKWTLENFTQDIVTAVNTVYEDVTTKEFREDAFRTFLDADDIKELENNGWSISNHSAAHYPLSPLVDDEFVTNQFNECQTLVDNFSNIIDSWVIPFGFGKDHYKSLLNNAGKPVIHVGNRFNTNNNWDGKNLFRYEVPNSHSIKSMFN